MNSFYQNVWLASGSFAHQLHTEGRFKDLKMHLRYLEMKEDALRAGIALPPPPNYTEGKK